MGVGPDGRGVLSGRGLVGREWGRSGQSGGSDRAVGAQGRVIFEGGAGSPSGARSAPEEGL